MRYGFLYLILILGGLSACMTASDHPPTKRPDFSVSKEQRLGATSAVITSANTGSVTTSTK